MKGTQIQFSHAPRYAIVFPWSGDYIKSAKEILALPNPKWGWNIWAFDDPRLEAEGVMINGQSDDLMWGWHHLQRDIPRNLQFATSFYAPLMPPWKHTAGTDLATYGGADVDSVQRIGVQLFNDLKAAGVLTGYERHVRGLWPILKRMCRRGLPIDLRAREELKAEIIRRKEEVDETIQRLVPVELRGIHPENGYKVIPQDLRELFVRHGLHTAGSKKALTFAPDFKRVVEEGLGLKCKEFEPGVERFYRELRFLPNSTDQLKAYMRAKGHPVPIKLKERNEDGSAKETTGKKEILRLFAKTKDDFYRLVIESRELSKIYSTYVEGWQIGSDGRVHSVFTFATGSGQLTSRNPNI